MQVEEKEDDEKFEYGAPLPDKSGEFSKKTDFIINKKLIENIENMEEKVFSASMQTKVSLKIPYIPLNCFQCFISLKKSVHLQEQLIDD